MNKPTIVAASALTALVLAGGIGVGIASADPTTTPSPSTSPSSSATAAATPTAKTTDRAKARHPKRDLAARALHGEVTLGGKKTRVVDFQRGTVTAVSATSLSVRSTDGFDATYVVVPATTVRKKKAAATIADVATGDRVRVIALREGTTVTAKRIGDAGPR